MRSKIRDHAKRGVSMVVNIVGNRIQRKSLIQDEAIGDTPRSDTFSIRDDRTRLTLHSVHRASKP